MKLSNRVRSLILPVLTASFLLVGAGVYVVERQSIISLNRSAADLEATELAADMNQYALLGKSFISSLVHSDALRYFLDSDDDHFKSLALSSGLDGILNSLADLSADHFSITFIRSNGVLEYYYENSLDPFSEPDPFLPSWATRQFADHVVSSSVYNEEKKRLVFCQILDRLTLKSPLDFSSENSVAVIVELSPTEYLHRAERLQIYQRKITFWGNMVLPPSPGQFEARHLVMGLGTVSVAVDDKVIQAGLRKVLLRLIVWYVLFTGSTYIVLQWLLQRYVLGPINRLEQQLSGVDLEATEEIEVIAGNDEIGKLSQSFARLYGKLKETYDGTRELAERDALTSLYNRRVFNLALEELLNQAKTDKSRVALIYIDIDNFKYVNDHFGHFAGDILLRGFAGKLSDVVRDSDVVFPKSSVASTTARLAGDEFAVIVHGYKDDTVPGKVAGRIRCLCQDGLICEGQHFPVTLSIGVAVFPADGENVEQLVIAADSAMYESKKSGKNAVTIFSEKPAE